MELVWVIALVVAGVLVVGLGILLRPTGPPGSSEPLRPPSGYTSKKAADKASDGVDASDHLPKVDIYYGSQTGTAENYAKQLANAAKKAGFKGKAVDLVKWKGSEVEDTGGLAVFLMATYGEGDPTDNAVNFVKYLNSADMAPTALSKLKYTVFGLGDRGYEHYNKMGKVVDARLEALGAHRVYALGLGDNSGNLEEDFDSWAEGLWTALAAVTEGVGGGAGAKSGAGALAPMSTRGTGDDLPPMPWRVVMVTPPAPGTTPATLAPAAMAAAAARADLRSKHFFTSIPVPVTVNRELRQVTGIGASTRHVELDLEGTDMRYVTADNLYVWPENDGALVASVARTMGYDLDEWFTLELGEAEGGDSDVPTPLFPVPTTVRNLLTRYIDLTGPPRKDLFAALAHYVSNHDEKDRLSLLVSREGKATFNDWVVGEKRSVAEALYAFPSLRVPLEAFVHIMPRLQSRAYTTCTSSLVQPTRVGIVATVVDEVKPGSDKSRRLQGVCTNYLARATVGTRMMVHVKTSTFRLPPNPATPIIMIGPGTGIAPMRAFLQERAAQRAAGVTVGDTWLFFGCRNSEEDFIYRDELEGHVASGTLTRLVTAFSRQTATKVYVQHRLEELGVEVAALIARGAHVYVCGATAMGHDVSQALERVLARHGGPDGGEQPAAAAAAAMEALHASGRMVQELWS